MYPILDYPWTEEQYAQFATDATEAGLILKTLESGDLEMVEPPPPADPTLDEQKERREAAYRSEVDPITAHIVRLRDMEPASEEIPELVEQRAQKVEEIRTRYPYPEEVA